MFESFKDSRSSKWIALLFAWIGGYVEAIGYITLFNIFVGPMSGNTIVLGVTASALNWSIALTRLATIGTFGIGVLFSSLIRELLLRYHRNYVATVLFFLELFFLLLFFVLGTFVVTPPFRTATGWGFYVLMIPAVLSMAIQTGALRKVGSVSVASTVVTSTVANTNIHLVHALLLMWDRYRDKKVDEEELKQAQRAALLYFSLWICYVVGATLGAALERVILLYALWVPISILLCLVVASIVSDPRKRKAARQEAQKCQEALEPPN